MQKECRNGVARSQSRKCESNGKRSNEKEYCAKGPAEGKTEEDVNECGREFIGIKGIKYFHAGKGRPTSDTGASTATRRGYPIGWARQELMMSGKVELSRFDWMSMHQGMVRLISTGCVQGVTRKAPPHHTHLIIKAVI